MNRAVLVGLSLLALLGTYVFVVAPRVSDKIDQDVAAATAAPATPAGPSGDPVATPAGPSGDPVATTDSETPPTSSPTSTVQPGPFPREGRTFVGLFTKAGPHNFADTEAFIEATGVMPAVHEFSAGWAHGAFDAALFDRLAERGMMPMLAWEPWDYLSASPRWVQDDYQLTDIIQGHYDLYIRAWARGIRDLGYPVAIRFAHEMNGNWYPWSERVNGNEPGEYVEAYQHVHDIFTDVGADNAVWVWSPNVNFGGSVPFEPYYPGDEYVDWLGIVGYYGTGAESFDQIYGDSLAALNALADKPVVITEIGAPDTDGRQEEWVRDMFDSLPDYPSVIGFIWFEVEIVENWRLADHEEAAKAFAEEADDKRYSVAWGPNSRPVLKAPR
jgi:hypothetical protein